MDASRNEIERIRRSLGLSQAEFASRMGVTQGTVSRWEQGINLSQKVIFAAQHLLTVGGASNDDQPAGVA